jgi:glycosyltransferase involved in cell wall biosynthesis
MSPASSQPLISICIGSYNHAGFINATLDSVLADGYSNKEVVVADDDSTDGTGDVVEAYVLRQGGSSVPIRLIRRPHSGVARTFNAAISTARGEYLALLASDDQLVPGGLEARYAYLASHEGKSVVFGDARVIDVEGSLMYDSAFRGMWHTDPRRYIDAATLRREFICHWAMPGSVIMFARTAIDTIGLFDAGLSVEDWDFCLRAAALGLIGYVDTPVACYRLHGDNSNLSSTARLKHLVDLRRTSLHRMGGFQFSDRLSLLGYAAKCTGSIMLEATRRVFR